MMRWVGSGSVGGALVALVGICGSATIARANGFDVPDVGARGLGRGGALTARVDDPLAIYYNPAALTLLPNPQIMLGTHFGFLSFCAQPSGTYGDRDPAEPVDWDGSGDRTVFDPTGTMPGLAGTWALGDDVSSTADDIAFPEVCQDGPLGVSPHLLFGMPIGDRFGLGIGVMAPSAAGHLTWGETDDDPQTFGTVRDPTGRSGNGRLPAPTRYGLVEAFRILLFPTVSFAWAPTHMLRVGISAQWGMAIIKFVNVTRATPGADPATDIYTELNATDFFVPSIIGSVMFTPLDNGRHLLDAVAWFRYTDSVRASGDLELRSTFYSTDSTPVSETFENTQIEAPQTAEFRLGVRYANRYSSRPRRRSEVETVAGRTDDNMSNERFDIELDFAYELTSMVDEFVVSLHDSDLVHDDIGPIPTPLAIAHNWKDTISLRLGGDWNAIPGLAALRLGFSFETGAMPDDYLVLDFPALGRFGAHAGVTVRFGKFDISLGYAHFFMFSQEASPEEARGRQTSAIMSEGAAAGEGLVVSAGRLTAHLDMLSLGVTFNFR